MPVKTVKKPAVRRQRSKLSRTFYLRLAGQGDKRHAVISRDKAFTESAVEYLAGGRKRTHQVEVIIDVPGIALRLAERAVSSTGGQAVLGGGLVRVRKVQA
jgi:hypothetical protein